jgi:Lipase
VNSTAEEDGCDEEGNFSFIVHGWLEGVISTWIPLTVSNLLEHRKGCVYVIDYSKYSNTSNYFAMTPHFNGIATVLTKKVQNVANFESQYFFGFSFGSQLSIEVGKRIGQGKIDRMDLCDPAGKCSVSEFDFLKLTLSEFCHLTHRTRI